MVKHSRNDGCLPCEESLSLSWLGYSNLAFALPQLPLYRSLFLLPSILPSFLPSYLSKLAWCAWKGLVVSLLDADCERDNIDAVNRSRDIVTNRIATRGGIVYSLMNNGLEAGGTTRYRLRLRWLLLRRTFVPVRGEGLATVLVILEFNGFNAR